MNSFDNIIKSKLEGIHPMPSDDAWSKFTKKKNNVHQVDKHTSKVVDADLKFDSYLQSSLSNIVPAYNPAHWSLLYAKLQIIQTRQNTVLVSKTIELVSIFLIILTFFHVNVFEFSEKPSSVNTAQAITTSTPNNGILKAQKDNKTDNKINTGLNRVNSKAQSLLPSPTIKSLDNNQKTKTTLKPEATKLIIASAPIATLDDETFDTGVSGLDMQPTTNHNPDIASGQDNIGIEDSNNNTERNKSPETIATVALQSTDIDFNESTIITKNKTYVPSDKLEKIITLADIVEKMESKDLSIVSKLARIQPEVYSEIALSFPEIKYVQNDNKKTYLLAFTSADINLINTPFDKVYSKAAYSKEAQSNSYGLLIGKQKNNLSVETGLIYSNRTYQPQAITDIYGRSEYYYYEKTFNKISYDIISVPLNLKYHFINNKKWSAYVVSNLALNLVVNAHYNINKEIKTGNIAARFDSESSRLSEKGFISGIFHSGQVIENSYASSALKDNYFVTMGLGFGVTKSITDQLSVFVQPFYNRHVFSSDLGIGPNKDKIHSASLMMGVTYDLP